VPTFPDASPPDASDAASTAFFLLATETPGYPAGDGSNWGDVVRFRFDADYQTAVPGVALAKGPTITDPLGLAFRWSSASLFVANRAATNANQATIVSFPYNAATQTFGAGTVEVSGYTSFMQLAFDPPETEMFVGTNNDGMRRFKLIKTMWVSQPQPATAPDEIRGVAVSPSGRRLYASTAANIIRQWDLLTNTELPSYTVKNPNTSLHFMSLCGAPITGYTTGCSPPQLYVGDAKSGGGAIYRFDIDPSDNLTKETVFAAAPTFSSALSPDGLELFGGESSANTIQRFMPPAWTLETTLIPTNNNIGTILVFPSDAVPVSIH
jgi:WD40 repeat protein